MQPLQPACDVSSTPEERGPKRQGNSEGRVQKKNHEWEVEKLQKHKNKKRFLKKKMKI